MNKCTLEKQLKRIAKALENGNRLSQEMILMQRSIAKSTGLALDLYRQQAEGKVYLEKEAPQIEVVNDE